MNSHLHHTSHRRGFTLLELLIVVSIIAILMGLTFSVMFGLTEQAEVEATVVTVRKVDAVLQQRVEGFQRAFKGDRLDAASNIVRAKLSENQIFGVRDEVIEVLAKKRAFRYEFPQRMVERYVEEHPSGSGEKVTGMADSIFKSIAAPYAIQQLVEEGTASPSDTQIIQRAAQNWARHDPATESAELLYFALTAASSYGAGSVDSGRFTEREVADTDDDGLPEFVDAWGNPLRFYRWPTRLIDSNPPVPFQPDLTNQNDVTDRRFIAVLERETADLLFRGLSPPPLPLPNGVTPRDLLLTDPDDPVGRLYAELERLNGADGRPRLAIEFNEANYHTPETYHTPLIVSPGPDGDIGLLEPVLTDASTNTYGNLASIPDVDADGDFDADDHLAIRDVLLDNITNRNRRAGGRR